MSHCARVSRATTPISWRSLCTSIKTYPCFRRLSSTDMRYFVRIFPFPDSSWNSFWVRIKWFLRSAYIWIKTAAHAFAFRAIALSLAAHVVCMYECIPSILACRSSKEEDAYALAYATLCVGGTLKNVKKDMRRCLCHPSTRNQPRGASSSLDGE